MITSFLSYFYCIRKLLFFSGDYCSLLQNIEIISIGFYDIKAELPNAFRRKLKKYIRMMETGSTGNKGVPVEIASAGQMEVFIN